MGEHGLRMKIAPYDASYRSPLIVSRPGTIPEGKFCKQTPSAPDLIMTFFAAAGIKPPAGMHGRDLTPLLKNPGAGVEASVSGRTHRRPLRRRRGEGAEG
jgi:arylsulfatase A-like enzyme